MSARNLFLVGLLAFSLPEAAVAEDPKAPAKQFFVPAETFEVAGRPAFVMLPAKELRKTPQPWIWYFPTLPGYPDEHEKWMDEQFVAAGIAVAGIDVGESYGSPAGNKVFDQFYNEMVQQRGYKAKPCLLGRSRGGLMASSWATLHPECVAGLAGIYPVFDFRTYPGLDKAAPAYELPADQLAARLAEFNPIERVDALAKAHVPVFIIHGDIQYRGSAGSELGRACPALRRRRPVRRGRADGRQRPGAQFLARLFPLPAACRLRHRPRTLRRAATIRFRTTAGSARSARSDTTARSCAAPEPAASGNSRWDAIGTVSAEPPAAVCDHTDRKASGRASAEPPAAACDNNRSGSKDTSRPAASRTGGTADRARPPGQHTATRRPASAR